MANMACSHSHSMYLHHFGWCSISFSLLLFEQTVHQLSDFEQSLEPNMIKYQIIAKLLILNG